jgi:hypothetical protein
LDICSKRRTNPVRPRTTREFDQ